MYWQAVLKLEVTSGSAARNRYIELLHPRRIQNPWRIAANIYFADA